MLLFFDLQKPTLFAHFRVLYIWKFLCVNILHGRYIFNPSPIHCSTSRSIPHHTIYKIIYDTYSRRAIQRVDNYSQQHEDNGNDLNQSIYSSIRSDGYPSIDPFHSKMDSKGSAFYWKKREKELRFQVRPGVDFLWRCK